jgi:hypothetical protein
MQDIEENAPLMMDDAKSQKSNKSVKSVKSVKSNKGKVAAAKPQGRPKPIKDDFCSCCCCAFQVHDPTSREQKCCFCFPLKAGVFWLIILSFVFVIIQVVLLILMSKNKYLNGWYVFFELLALFPSFVAVAFFIYYLSDDTKASRSKVYTGFLLIALSVLLMGLISIIYITGIYDPDRVYIGYGEINDDGDETHYYSETKKEYVYEQIIIILGLGGFYAFNAQGAQTYANSFDPPATQ